MKHRGRASDIEPNGLAEVGASEEEVMHEVRHTEGENKQISGTNAN